MGNIKVALITEGDKVKIAVEIKEATPTEFANIIANIELVKLQLLEKLKALQTRVER